MSVSVIACILAFSSDPVDIYTALGKESGLTQSDVVSKVFEHRDKCEKEYGKNDVLWLVDYFSKMDSPSDFSSLRKDYLTKDASYLFANHNKFKKDVRGRNVWMFNNLQSELTWLVVKDFKSKGRDATACLLNYSGAEIAVTDELIEHRLYCRNLYGVDVAYELIRIRDQFDSSASGGDIFSSFLSNIAPLEGKFPGFYKRLISEW